MKASIHTPWRTGTIIVGSGLLDEGDRGLCVEIQTTRPSTQQFPSLELNLAATEELIAVLQEAVREFKAGEAK